MIIHRCKNLISLSFSFKPTISTLYSSHHCFSSIPSRSRSLPVSDFLINRHGFSSETALAVSNLVTNIRSPERADSVLALFNQCGFSKPHLEKLVKLCPKILSANPEKTIKPKIKIFQDLGFSVSDIADIIANYPWILRRSADKQLLSIVLLKDFVGTNSAVSKILKRSSWFLGNNLHKTMIPNIEFMKSCGICGTQISKLLFSVPRFFTFRPETIRYLVKRVDEMGYDRSSKMYIHAIRVLGSMTEENWEVKMQVFRALGWSQDDILFVFRRNPGVFTISDRKIREIVEYLGSAGGYDSSFLVLHPELLIYSLEGRIKPRLRVLQILRRKNLVNVSLPTICKMKDDEFAKRYVLPYVNDVGKVYKVDE